MFRMMNCLLILPLTSLLLPSPLNASTAPAVVTAVESEEATGANPTTPESALRKSRPSGPSVACGQTITTDTKLEADLFCSSDTQFALIIGSSNITLDLGGHLLSFNGPAENTAVGILTSNVTGVTIKNGEIEEFERAINILGGRGVTVENVSISNLGTVISDASELIVFPRAPGVATDFDLGPGGTESTTTVDWEGATTTGYVIGDTRSGAPPYGTAVFSFKQNGVSVSEAGVPASPPTTGALIFVDCRTAAPAIPGRISAGRININTGIAVANTGSVTADIFYTLRDISGATLSIGHGTLAAGTHFAKFIDQLREVAPDFELPDNFSTRVQFAILDISSNRPVSIVSLRMTTNQRNEVLFTTTPVADLAKPAIGGTVSFPQLADGGGYTTSIILLNTSDHVETGTLSILDDYGNPLMVHAVGGTTGSRTPYSISIGGAFCFQTDGSSDRSDVGWVLLTPDPESPTPVGAGVFGYNPGDFMVMESGIPAATGTTHARIYVDLSGRHDTGLAIANLADDLTAISISAFASDGVTFAGSTQEPVRIPGNGHTAHFARDFIAGLPAGFTGVLEIASPTPIAALTMRPSKRAQRFSDGSISRCRRVVGGSRPPCFSSDSGWRRLHYAVRLDWRRWSIEFDPCLLGRGRQAVGGRKIAFEPCSSGCLRCNRAGLNKGSDCPLGFCAFASIVAFV